MQARNTSKLRVLGVDDVRETNELKFLHLIRDRQPISRADLAKATGLRAGTVSVIVNRLIKAGIVYEGEEAPSSGGRPPTYLQVNAEKAYVAGASVGVHETIYAVSDFNGRILHQRSLPTESDASLFAQKLGRELTALAAENFGRERLAAVSVSVPGLIDRQEGKVVVSPNLGWTDVPLAALLGGALGVPVHVENDANAAALSELWYGPTEIWTAHTVLFILVVEGIGTGLILNGEVYAGTRVGMGGFGHVSIDPNGPPCSCGNNGCWEALASDKATLERFHRAAKEDSGQVQSMRDLIAFAQQGHEIARRELITSASIIGRVIRGLAHGIAPDTVVIGGHIATAWSLVEPILRQELHSQYFIGGISQPVLRPASVEHPSLFGAIPVALRSVLQRRRVA